MQLVAAIKELQKWDQQGRYVFLRSDLAKLFPDDKPKVFAAGLAKLVATEIITRACYGVYVYAAASSRDSYTIERIALMLRRGEYSYVSLESMLAEYGIISQQPIDRLTVMTTGRKGIYHTLFGTIEFTHTKRSVTNILENTLVGDTRPLRIATRQAAWRDLKRVGRNLNLVIAEELNND